MAKTPLKSDLRRMLGMDRPAKNRYGLDCAYFRKNLRHIIEHMDNYTPDELRRSLVSLANTATPTTPEAME